MTRPTAVQVSVVCVEGDRETVDVSLSRIKEIRKTVEVSLLCIKEIRKTVDWGFGVSRIHNKRSRWPFLEKSIPERGFAKYRFCTKRLMGVFLVKSFSRKDSREGFFSAFIVFLYFFNSIFGLWCSRKNIEGVFLEKSIFEKASRESFWKSQFLKKTRMSLLLYVVFRKRLAWAFFS